MELIHLFRSKSGKYYIYNAATNEIFETNKTTYDFIKSEEDIIKKKEVFDKAGMLYIEKFKDFTEISKESLEERIENECQQLIFNVTERCNFRCSYCIYMNYFYRNKPLRDLSEEVAFYVLNSFLKKPKKAKVKAITFYGGEPLINFPLIKKIVQFAKEKEKDLTFAISTNGSFLNEEIVDFLEKNNFYIWVSLDGPKEIHDKYRKFKDNGGTFDIVIKNLQRIEKKNPKFYQSNINFLITISNILEIEKIRDFFSENPSFYGHSLKISPVITVNKKIKSKKDSIIKRKKLLQLEEEYINKVTQNKEDSFLDAIFLEDLLRIHRRPISYVEKIWPNGICIPGTHRLFVHTDGNLSPCEKVGNNIFIGRMDIEKEKVFKLIEDYKNISKKCLECWAARLCRQCFSSASINNGLLKRKKESLCKNILYALHRSLILYCTVLESLPSFFDKRSNFGMEVKK